MNIRDLKRHLNSIEHMVYVSCKFTRTTEMLRKVIETIVTGYEMFFGIAYQMFAKEEDYGSTLHDKIQVLKDGFLMQNIQVDFTDYFLLKRLLLSDFESIGQYRKNLCMVYYIDDQEYVINLMKLHELYATLKEICNGLSNIKMAL